jgi:Mn-dependent DtxR family transcriptional regulator
VLDVEQFREEAQQLEPVIDETVAERLDTIIDREPQCPDCFSPEKDACALLELEVDAAD